MGVRGVAAGLWLVLGLAVASADVAPGPTGRWDRDDGLGGVEIAPCGAALCGQVTWLKNPQGPAHVGERLLYDLRQTAATTWEGKAHNPEDGRDYDGTLAVDGDHMTTTGCVLRFICQSVGLTRAK